MDERLAGGKLLLDSPAEAVARLRISNPERRNALDHEILDALAEVLPQPRPRDRDPLRADHRRAAGLLGRLRHRLDPRAETFERDAEALVAHPFHAAMEAIAAHPWPTVAAINGHCLGGGLELAITCDLRICAAGAKLGMPPAKLGLVYGHTGLRKFLDTVGLARTKELFLTGRNLERRAGRADRPRQRGRRRRASSRRPSVELAAEIAANAPLSMRGNKQRDRPAQRQPGAQRAAGGGADRAARVLLRLRGLPRGHPRLRREAQARVERAGERQGARAARRRRPGDGGADRAGRRDRPGDAAAAAQRGAARRRLRGAAAGDRRPAALDQSGADDLPARPRPLRRHHARRPSSCWRRARTTCAAPASPAARSSTSATSPPTCSAASWSWTGSTSSATRR